MADAGPEQSGVDSDCDGPDRVVREWSSVLRDDGVACSGNGESRYPDAQGTQDGRQRIGTAGQTRRDIVVDIRGRRPSLPSGCRVFLMVFVQ